MDEAVAILESYNIAWGGGPALHYLIADASGRAVLVEFYEGEMTVIPNESPYHLATNHLRTTASGDGGCWRYATLDEQLTETEDGADREFGSWASHLNTLELLIMATVSFRQACKKFCGLAAGHEGQGRGGIIGRWRGAW